MSPEDEMTPESLETPAPHEDSESLAGHVDVPPVGEREETPSSEQQGAEEDSDAQQADRSEDDSDMSAFEEQIPDSDLVAAHAKIADLEDQLARANASFYNLDQEYAGYVRRSKEAVSGHRENGQGEVLDALIGVLDDIHAARRAGDLDDGPFAAIATKLEETLLNRFTFERFGAAGDDFDPNLHEALMARTNTEVDHPVVAEVLQPGYRRGERILRPVKVLVDNPE